jgi:hypothetical protein
MCLYVILQRGFLPSFLGNALFITTEVNYFLIKIKILFVETDEILLFIVTGSDVIVYL